MGDKDFADWPQLTGALTAHMTNVREVFNELIGDDESETQEESLSEQWRELWQDALQEDDATPVLAHLGEDNQTGANADCRFPQRAG
ncbi:hypothetical protein ACLK1U_17270 [Escherichia coli]